MQHPLRAFCLSATVALALAPPAASAARPDEPVREILKRQTQELLDAVAPGRVEVWERLLHPDAFYVTESGDVLHRAELLAKLRPLPPGMSGTLRVTGFIALVHGDTAVATHEDRETQDYHGQLLRARYRSTDTWRRTPDGWRLVASQLLAIPDNPPAVPFADAQLREYPGVYEAAPGLRYTIRREGERLFGRRGGRDESELRLEAPDVMFAPGEPRVRKIVRRDATGGVAGFADRREGHDIFWKRVADAE